MNPDLFIISFLSELAEPLSDIAKSSPGITGFIGILIMLLLFLTKIPVSYAMLITGSVGFCLLTSVKGGITMLSRNIFDVFASYHLVTIPIFILMGQLAFNSGIGKRLYRTAYHFTGNIRGGLAMATVSSCTAFGAVCGSSPATAATMTSVSIPEMKKFRYKTELASGSVAAGGGLGMIMPPSVVLIVYGILTEQSIGRLFLSGILPALLLTTLFILAIYIHCRRDPNSGPAGKSYSTRQKIRSLAGITDTLLIFLIVIGGIFKGFFTPTEAASVGVMLVIIISAIKKRMSLKIITKSMKETMDISAMVMLLITGAVIFGKFLTVTRIPFNASSFIENLNYPAPVIMILILIIYFIGGCFMDSLALIMLTIPVFYPVVLNLGYDPIWFGIIIVLVTEMGVITPPVGINVYIVYGILKKMGGFEQDTLETVFKGIIPFLFAVISGITILFFFPGVVTFLPDMMY